MRSGTNLFKSRMVRTAEQFSIDNTLMTKSRSETHDDLFGVASQTKALAM